MQIVKAQLSHFETVKQITHDTISEVYPLYYAKGVVDFFLDHHNDDNIRKDIVAGSVFLLFDGQKAVGTVTIRKNEICRLFVLPAHQHKGFGRELLAFAEKQIARTYTEIDLDSSLPAKHIYLQRGYITIETHQIVTENGDVLSYDLMRKNSMGTSEQ